MSIILDDCPDSRCPTFGTGVRISGHVQDSRHFGYSLARKYVYAGKVRTRENVYAGIAKREGRFCPSPASQLLGGVLFVLAFGLPRTYGTVLAAVQTADLRSLVDALSVLVHRCKMIHRDPLPNY